MPSRVTPLITGQIYHIYNRGTEKRRIFENRRDFLRFLDTIKYYQLKGPKIRLSHYLRLPESKRIVLGKEKSVEIITYCLMPNHFHLTIRQLEDGGITLFMTKLSLSYTKYYNLKYHRVGPLLQGEFRSVLIETDEQFMHLTRYIHLNPVVSFLVNRPDDYEWSSYNEYIGKSSENICAKEQVLALFKDVQSYIEFVNDHADYARELEIIKHQIIED